VFPGDTTHDSWGVVDFSHGFFTCFHGIFMGFSGIFPADLGTFQVLNATAICLTFAVFLFGLVVSQVKFGCRSG